MRAPRRMCPRFVFWFRRYIYICCLLSFFTFSISPPLLVFFFANRPGLFPGQMSYKATIPGFSILRLDCVVVRFFWLWMCAFVALGLVFFHTKPRDSLGETSPKWPILCRVGRKTTTHQSWLCGMACTVVKVVKAITRLMGKGKFWPLWHLDHWMDFDKFVLYNYVGSFWVSANPCDAATTWVVLTKT